LVEFQKNGRAANERCVSRFSSGDMFFVWRELCFYAFPTARRQLFSHNKPRSGFCDDERSEVVQTQYALLRNAACRSRLRVRL
jgi:hypothetical protein